LALLWTIEFREDFDREFQGFDDRVQDEILAKVIVLERRGRISIGLMLIR